MFHFVILDGKILGSFLMDFTLFFRKKYSFDQEDFTCFFRKKYSLTKRTLLYFFEKSLSLKGLYLFILEKVFL